MAEKYIIIGKIGAPYGLQGWIKIHAFTEFSDTILDYQPWFLAREGQEWRETPIEKKQIQSNRVMVKFSGVNSPEAASLYTGQLIAILRSQLPALQKNEYYWSDLIGLTVINTKGEIYGKVIYLMATGANDVLVVKGKKEFAIPYLWNEVITKIDLEKEIIEVNWEIL